MSRGSVFLTVPLCKPGIVYILNRAHSLHFFEVSGVPVLSWHNLFRSLIENAQQMKTITDFPLLWSDLLQSNRLMGQDFSDIKQITMPFNLAIVSHSSNGHARAVFYQREFVGVTTWRATINTAWGLSSQGLMGTLGVVLLYKKVKFALLLSVGGLGRDIMLEGSVHPFVTTVLAGLPRLDPFRTDAQLNPPLRQLAYAAQRQRSKRCPIVGTNGPRQSVFSEGSFKPGPNHWIAVLPQGLAHQTNNERNYPSV